MSAVEQIKDKVSYLEGKIQNDLRQRDFFKNQVDIYEQYAKDDKLLLEEYKQILKRLAQ